MTESTGIVERREPRRDRALAYGTACALPAFLLNAYLPLPLFGDFWLYVGQSLSLLALLFFGLPIAVTTALAAGAGLVLSTGQWPLLPLLLFELALIAILVSRGLPLILASVAYWLLIGLPLGFWLLPSWIIGAEKIVAISVITLGMNGLLNAAIASALFLVLASKIQTSAMGALQMTLLRQAFSMSVTLLVLPSLAIALFLVGQAIEGFSDEVERRLMQQAEIYSRLTELHLDRHQSAIAALADRHPEGPGSGVSAALEPLDRALPGFLSLVVVDSAGEVVDGFPSDFFARVQDAPQEARNVSDRDWFIQAREDRQAFLSDGFVGRGFGNDPIVAVSAPMISEDGRFLGVVEGSLNLPRFGDLEAFDDKNDLMLIVDRAGRKIYAPESLGLAPLARVDLKSIDDQRLNDIRQVVIDTDSFFAAQATTTQGWTVYALTRTDILISPVQRFIVAFGFGLLVLIGIGGWAARIFSGRISQPLSTLSAQVLDPERTGIELPRRQRTSPEIVRVSKALDQARRLSQGFKEELEREVAEKTAQLRDLNHRLGVMALSDPLTGLLNRRGFEVKAKAVFDQSAERAGDLLVAMIDIDHFKQINDSHGHAVGDLCLRALAKRLRTFLLEDEDLIARLGGEEFVVMMRVEAPEDGVERLERLRRQVAASPIELDAAAIAMTVSIGTAESSGDDGADLKDLLERADQAMYRSKTGGRNRLTRGSQGR